MLCILLLYFDMFPSVVLRSTVMRVWPKVCIFGSTLVMILDPHAYVQANLSLNLS